MNVQGLKTFFCANIRSLLSYGAPVWFSLLNESDNTRLEEVQRAATHIILPDLVYRDRLTAQHVQNLVDLFDGFEQMTFFKIANDSPHPVRDRKVFNQNRIECLLVVMPHHTDQR